MFKYYKWAALIPAGVAVILQGVFLAIVLRNYKSEWMTADGIWLLQMSASLFDIIVLLVLILPVYLARKTSVKSNIILTILVWFALPVAWLALIAIKMGLSYGRTFEEEVGALIIILPFVAGLTWSFSNYRMDSNNSVKPSSN